MEYGFDLRVIIEGIDERPVAIIVRSSKDVLKISYRLMVMHSKQ